MLDILGDFVSREGYSSRRLDGSTGSAKRGKLVNEFNNNPNIFIFLVAAKLELTQPRGLHVPASHPLEFNLHRCRPQPRRAAHCLDRERGAHTAGRAGGGVGGVHECD